MDGNRGAACRSTRTGEEVRDSVLGPRPRPSLKPRLLLVDTEPAHRLKASVALGDSFDVHMAPDGEDSLRAARTLRPDLALISVPARRSESSLRLCRTLKTDVRPVGAVGVYDRGAWPRPPGMVIGVWLADGYLTGACQAADLASFAQSLWRGERPIRLDRPPREPGRLRLLARRLRLD